MNTKKKNTIYLLIIGTLLFGGASHVASWSLPEGTAPDANSNPPVNTSLLTQKKKGNFAVSALATYSQAIFTGKVRIADGTQGVGKILVSGDNYGNATWVNPPEYAADGTTACPPGTTIMSSTGECGYQYTLTTGGVTYCNAGDVLVRHWDSGHGRNHGVAFMSPNGCYAWEGKKNYGGQSCTLECLGAVVMCYTKAGGGQWYLSGPNRVCDK